jgi:glycosyltransferase involved in cell wall biosynthesis
MRLTIVQYAGDYREAFERFASGGKATYQAQRYSVDFVGSLAQRLEQVVVICAMCDAPYDVVLSNKVRAIGAGLKPGFHPRELVPILTRTVPDRICLTTPMIPLLKWARRNRVRTITALADYFRKGGPRTAFRNWLAARELNNANVEWVGNHQIGACLSLLDIGVQADKVVPWDWPPSHRPSDYTPRDRDPSAQFRLAYVGLVEEAKGVGDLLRALQKLKADGLNAFLTVAGRDADDRMARLASSLGLGQSVRFAGLIPNEDVPGVMREADAVVIPSRHEYPEGLPLTIYEALAARTPIVASDHPMFRGAVFEEESAIIFPAGNADALASAIRRLSQDAELYSRLSANSEAAWRALQLPVSWGDLLERWVSDTPTDRQWLWDHRLSSGLYEPQIKARRET